MYQWLRANYPDMRVCMNPMAGGSPSQYFTDAIMIEGGGIATPQLVEDSKALMTTVVSYFSVFYYDIFPPVLKAHGLEFRQTIEAGLPDEVKADLWSRYLARGLKTVGLGGSLGGDPNTLVEHTPERRRAYPDYNGYAFYFPISRRTLELDRFCGLANGTPLVPSSFAVVTGAADVYGSAWAGPNRLLASIYNDGKSSRNLDVAIDKLVLRRYGLRDHGRLAAQLLGKDGLLLPGRTLRLHEGANLIRVQGRLGQGELALIQTVEAK
jgi:hypothetical protein